MLSTIPGVGADLTATKITDFVVVPPEGGLAGELSVILMTFDTEGQIDGNYAYLDENTGGMMGVDPGWYTFDSVTAWTPVSAANVVIPFGAGVQIQSDCGATITFAGEVLSENKDFAVNDSAAGGFTTTGNASPVDLTLKDFAITPPEGGLAGELSVILMTFDNEGQIVGNYAYLDENTGSMMGVDPGWYTFDSVTAWTPVSAGDVGIKAGEMFQIQSDCGATITVPSAL